MTDRKTCGPFYESGFAGYRVLSDGKGATVTGWRRGSYRCEEVRDRSGKRELWMGGKGPGGIKWWDKVR